VQDEIYISGVIISVEPMDEMNYEFSRGNAWDEERPNRKGYLVKDEDIILWYSESEFREWCSIHDYKKMTVKEVETVIGNKHKSIGDGTVWPEVIHNIRRLSEAIEKLCLKLER
jgi:hypothetical protein